MQPPWTQMHADNYGGFNLRFVCGSTVLEPFSGSGVVALEALLQGRNIIANDISPCCRPY
jgi:16S rRNA G966 N2-methylase RsmD